VSAAGMADLLNVSLEVSGMKLQSYGGQSGATLD
jgi:hypothetical protein